MWPFTEEPLGRHGLGGGSCPQTCPPIGTIIDTSLGLFFRCLPVSPSDYSQASLKTSRYWGWSSQTLQPDLPGCCDAGLLGIQSRSRLTSIRSRGLVQSGFQLASSRTPASGSSGRKGSISKQYQLKLVFQLQPWYVSLQKQPQD